MSKASSTTRAEDQSAHIDEQPATEQDTLGLPENSREQENGGPSEVKLPSDISNTGPSQPSEPHEQESASKAAADDDLVPQAEKVVAEKDQPSLGEFKYWKFSRTRTIASKSGKDNRSRFWGVYKRVAEEHDGEFLERYTGDMDNRFGLPVSTSFIVAMESNLIPDPSDTTNALLKQLVYIGLGNFTAAGLHALRPSINVVSD
ncbi:hypothetical protein DFJ58DRAFT_736243 [Suillus subalutaceus]|uniref:uncharacterized protein n=1 Tax=Suillus subalutaceus TaxID=48586 RepID=UPI001B864281|nr:uncharacterized protein DFJ58DRAFT_736243 [Suillus subalutaceus]KAG1832874.1 hypothetical protein DFJ58DRAFT_736243 [Suillus subalutaceus]